MADRKRRSIADTGVLTASARSYLPKPIGVYGSVQRLLQPMAWQDEVWQFYDNGGEFAYGTTWRANMLSQVRLLAAERMPGGEEPAPLEGDHPAVELVSQLGGLDGSTNELMKAFGIHLGVAGSAWLVGTEIEPGQRDWFVLNAKEIRPKDGGYERLVADGQWQRMAGETVLLQIWDPDPQASYRAYSLAKPALPILRKIDMYDRRIVATLLSRLAMNGFLLIPSELTLPVREEFASAADPFIAELIEFASQNIRQPGTAGAAIPFPIRGAAQYLEQVRHLAVFDGVDEKLLQNRDSELLRLARTLQIPEEVLTGMGDANHWSAAQIEEGAIKSSIAPIAEVIASGLTRSYLHPILGTGESKLTGPNGGLIVVWYDTSQITVKPDRSREAIELYDRNEITGETLRRETGFDDSDKPDKTELKDQLLKWAGRQMQTFPAAYKELTGEELEIPAPPEGAAPPGGALPKSGGRPGVTGPAPPAGRPAAPALPMRSGPTVGPPRTAPDRKAAALRHRVAVASNGREMDQLADFRQLFGLEREQPP